jgi:hypothetical protein
MLARYSKYIFSLLKNEIQESILLTKEIKVSQDSNLV